MPTIFDGVNRACLGVFGEQVIYQQRGADPLTPKLVIKDPSVLADVSPAPALVAEGRLSDLPSPPAIGDILTRFDVPFKVYKVNLSQVSDDWFTIYLRK